MGSYSVADQPEWGYLGTSWNDYMCEACHESSGAVARDVMSRICRDAVGPCRDAVVRQMDDVGMLCDLWMAQDKQESYSRPVNTKLRHGTQVALDTNGGWANFREVCGDDMVVWQAIIAQWWRSSRAGKKPRYQLRYFHSLESMQIRTIYGHSRGIRHDERDRITLENVHLRGLEGGTVVHGTNEHGWQGIFESGAISSASRDCIHFGGSKASPSCKGGPYFVYLDLGAALEAGYEFYSPHPATVLCGGCGGWPGLSIPLDYVCMVTRAARASSVETTVWQNACGWTSCAADDGGWGACCSDQHWDGGVSTLGVDQQTHLNADAPVFLPQ